MKNRILLVGGSGYLGSHLVPHLRKNSYEVYITGTKKQDAQNYYQIDFQNPSSFQCLVNKKFDLIIVLAACMDAIGKQDLTHRDLRINTINFGHFLEFIAKNEVGAKLIYTSSMTVYSKRNASPVKEGGQLEPMHIYGLSKVLAESIISFFCKKNSIPGVILRVPGIYGGNRKDGFIYNAIKQLKENKTFTLRTVNLGYWEAIYIYDLCDIINRFLRRYSWEKDIDIFNISYGEETDICDTAKFIADNLGFPNNLNFKDKKGYLLFYLSNKKLANFVEIKQNYFKSLKSYINQFFE
jgi:nucleoside-diphosphate-sugar epimerase